MVVRLREKSPQSMAKATGDTYCIPYLNNDDLIFLDTRCFGAIV